MSDANKTKCKIPKLENASQHARWKSSTQDHMFKLMHNSNIDTLRNADTLDPAYFEKHFNDDYQAASKHGAEVRDPFDNEDDPDFPELCFQHALSTGRGFHGWVYALYTDLRASLSDDIQDKTGGVPRGDLVGLFAAIKLAVLHFEDLDPDDLFLTHAKCNMETDGGNDFMTFLAKLTDYRKRLRAAGHPVTDSQAQRVLLKGLNQDVFAFFIATADRHPYDSIEELQQAAVMAAAKPRMLAALRALKPGNPQQNQATFAMSATGPLQNEKAGITRNSDQSRDQFLSNTQYPQDRLSRLEALVESLAKRSNLPADPTRSQGRNLNAAGKPVDKNGLAYPCKAFKDGTCTAGDRCRASHAPADISRLKFCAVHKTCLHTTAECNKRPQGSVASVNAMSALGLNGYEFTMATRCVSETVFSLRNEPKINLWCVDGASTTHATWDRSRCFDIRPCNVTIHGMSKSGDHLVCTEMGDTYVDTYDAASGTHGKILLKNALIHAAIPFHVFSEILGFEQKCTATKELGSWQFFAPSARGEMVRLCHASQHLIRSATAPNLKLYFIDENEQQQSLHPDTASTNVTVAADSATTNVTVAADSVISLPTSTSADQQPPSSDDLSHRSASISSTSHRSLASDDLSHRSASISHPTHRSSESASVVSAPAAKKISLNKNLQMLLELHLAHGHWNFPALAAQYGLSLPSPPPNCWACLVSKPRHISHDKESTRVLTREGEGYAADAKGPFNTPTPEGYLYFFLIVCLYSHCYWTILAKSQAEWKEIWPTFVKKREARLGHQRSISHLITDCHKVHMAKDITAFNEARGIEGITTAPHSQWQDPAERGIQTITNASRTSMIHGGGKAWMWGWAVRHSTAGANRMHPPRPVPGHEGQSRLRIAFPAVTPEKEMRTQRPFLSLCFKTKPKNEVGSNMKPRAEPCVFLCYVSTRKAYALLTIPNLYLTWSIEVRFVPLAFPLRVTDYLANQLDTFLRPTVEDDMYNHIHGPGNALRRTRTAAADPAAPVVEESPTLVRTPITPASLPGPGYSSTRGYTPSDAGLRSIASMQVTVARPAPSAPTYTPDQLAARTPRTAQQALAGPDAAYWLPSMLKDFAIVRDNGCIINITTVRPPGPRPPGVEQRFKIKYRGDQPIALADIDAKDWKTRTVTRGDRFKYGVHYEATAAPVVHAPALKMLIAWAVSKGLLLYQWDQGAAFYGNAMDRPGIIVQLPPGYDPDSNALRPLHLPPLFGELAKGLPGIPQGSLLQYLEMAPDLQELQFKPIDADNCIFLHTDMDMATSLHVDDGVLACPSHRHAEQVLGPMGLGAKRTITWGPLRNTLGIEFTVNYSANRRQVFMNQRAYAVTILERAGMLDCNPKRTPAIAGRKYTVTDCPRTEEQRAALAAEGLTKDLYHCVTASLNFLVCTTRDDMRFIQGKLAKYCRDPGMEHFNALKHALRFLHGSLDYGIDFVWRSSDPAPLDGPLVLVAWTDSSFADDVDTGRTTIGNVIQVNGATVSASSKLSSRVDSCVNHSELHAFGDATAPPSTVDVNQTTDGAELAFNQTARTVTWIRGIKAALERRDFATMPPTPVNVDNSGVLAMLKDRTLKSANRHIYRTLAENRERVHLDHYVQPVKVDTRLNLANALTKQEPGYAESAAQLRQITGPIST